MMKVMFVLPAKGALLSVIEGVTSTNFSNPPSFYKFIVIDL